jgi:hypothetical protein
LGHYATSRKVGVRFPMRSLDFSMDLIFPVALWPWVQLSLQQQWVPGIFLGDKGLPVHKAGNLTANFEPIFYKIWESRRFTTLWASTACYRGSLNFFYSASTVLPFELPDEKFHMCETTKRRTSACEKNRRFLLLWLWRLLYSGIWRRVVWDILTNIPEVSIASIFKEKEGLSTIINTVQGDLHCAFQNTVT